MQGAEMPQPQNAPSPVDMQMLQQQLAPAVDENELAMAQAPQVAGMFDNTSLGGQQGGFLAPERSPEQERQERSYNNRQNAKDSIKKTFAPRDSAQDSAIFNKLRKILKPGTEY
jgi:hypothetical protein